MGFRQEYKKKSFSYLHGLLHYIEPEISNVKNSQELIVNLIDTFSHLAFEKILLISSDEIADNQLLENLYKLGLKSNINFISYPLTDNQATVFHVEKALHKYVSNNCEAILIMGDSVAIDLGKAVKARVLNPNKNIYQMRGFTNIPIRKQEPLLFIVPLSLAGNESNLSCYVLDHTNFKKIGIFDRLMSADYIYYCPLLLANLSMEQFIGTICISLANALEALISENSTKNSKATADLAIKLILDAFENSVFKEIPRLQEVHAQTENNVKTKISQEKKEKFRSILESLQEAANLSGTAAANSLTGYTQALSNALEVHYQVVNYKISPMLFLAVLKMYQKQLTSSNQDNLQSISHYSDLFSEISEALVKIISNWQLQRHFTFLRTNNFDSIIGLTEKEMATFYASPFELDKDNLVAILKSVQ
ncbi:MAG: iron-containing alcohol dehydrogenase [Clostridiaceae bacterium]|nr:iron-containing alcohol dehydrogenase [Clostridiaceae bacterium]